MKQKYESSGRRRGELPVENDAQRKAFLQWAIKQIKSSDDMADRDLRFALTRDEWKAYRAKMKELNAPVPRRIASIFKEYTDLVQYADQLWNLDAGNRSSNRGRGPRTGFRLTELLQQAVSAYGRALKVLNETDRKYPGTIYPWLDRPFYRDGDDF